MLPAKKPQKPSSTHSMTKGSFLSPQRKTRKIHKLAYFGPETSELLELASQTSPRSILPLDHSSIINNNNPTTLTVSRISYNAPFSNRSDVRDLETRTHLKLHTVFEQEQKLEISTLNRHIQQIQIFDESMKELCSLIRTSCSDQATLLWRIWSSVADLYGSVYTEMITCIKQLKLQLTSQTHHTYTLEQKLAIMRKQKGLEPSERKTTQISELTIIRTLEEEILQKDREMLQLHTTITNLSLWFPHFARFGGSVLSRFLPPLEGEGGEIFTSPHLDQLMAEHESGIQDDVKSLKTHFHLAQDYLVHDLKRLEELGIGLAVSHGSSKPSHSHHHHQHEENRRNNMSTTASISQQSDDLQSLAYGLFGGPQSSTSFSVAQNDEYSLAAIRQKSLLMNSNNATQPASPMSLSEVEAAARRTAQSVVRREAKVFRGTVRKSHTKPQQQQQVVQVETSPVVSEYDMSAFHRMQSRRVTGLSFSSPNTPTPNLSHQNTLHEHDEDDEFDPELYVDRSDYDLLEEKLKLALTQLQSLEATLLAEQQSNAEKVATLERHLKQCQGRERQLRETLKECRSEADTILHCLPTRCYLPIMPTLSTSTSIVSNKRMKNGRMNENQSRFGVFGSQDEHEEHAQQQQHFIPAFSLEEIMLKCHQLLTRFSSPSIGREPSSSTGSTLCSGWSYDTLTNLLSGQGGSSSLFTLPPLSMTIQLHDHSLLHVSSVSLAVIHESTVRQAVTSHKGIHNALTVIRGLVESTCRLMNMEIMADHYAKHGQEKVISTSTLPWQQPDDTNSAERGNERDSEGQRRYESLLHFLTLFGLHMTVDYPSTTVPPNTHNHSQSQSQSLNIGIPEGSILSLLEDQDDTQKQHETTTLPPIITFQVHPIDSQRIYLDLTLHIQRAISLPVLPQKQRVTTSNFTFSAQMVPTIIERVFTLISGTGHKPEDINNLSNALLRDKAVVVLPWWRFITPRLAQRLANETLQIAYTPQPLRNEDQVMDIFQFTRLCHFATVEMQNMLSGVLKEMALFCLSLSCQGGPGDAFFSMLLAILLTTSPLHSDDSDDLNEGATDHSKPLGTLLKLKQQSMMNIAPTHHTAVDKDLAPLPSLGLALEQSLLRLPLSLGLSVGRNEIACGVSTTILQSSPPHMAEILAPILAMHGEEAGVSNSGNSSLTAGSTTKVAALQGLATQALPSYHNKSHKHADSKERQAELVREDIYHRIAALEIVLPKHLQPLPEHQQEVLRNTYTRLQRLGCGLLTMITATIDRPVTAAITPKAVVSVSATTPRSAMLQRMHTTKTGSNNRNFFVATPPDTAASTTSAAAKTKIDIPAVQPSYLLESLRYRRLLYDDNITDEAEDEEDLKQQKKEQRELDFVDRLLFHLRLCFDPKYVEICAPSFPHMFFTVSIAAAAVGTELYELLQAAVTASNDKSEAVFQEKMEKEVLPAMIMTTREEINLQVKLHSKAAKSHYRQQVMKKVFAAWLMSKR